MKESIVVSKSKWVFLIVLLISVLLVFTLSACSTIESEPQFDSSWYGTFTSYNVENKGTIITINKDGLYIDGENVDCTVENNKIKITQSGFILERSVDGLGLHWMISTEFWNKYPTARSGRVSAATYTKDSTGKLVSSWTLSENGTTYVSRYNSKGFPETYSGIYVLKDGVLVEKFTSMGGDPISLYRTCYIDEKYYVYLSHIKDLDNYLGLFDNWNDDSSNEDSQNNKPDETQNLPEEVFYDVVYSAGEGGSIQGSTNQHIKQGENGTTVNAVANEGYEFVSWSDGKTTAARQDSNIMASANYQAIFRRISFALQYTAGEGGTISGDATQSVEYGANATVITATPSTGYEFVAWSDGKTTASRQETNVNESANYQATFRRISYSLQYMAGEGGSISGSVTQSVDYGENGLSVTAVPDEGFEFVGWSDGITTATRCELTIKRSYVAMALFGRKLSAMQGNGTEESPYLIKSAEDLRAIEHSPHSYYLLQNDITLPTVPEGQSNFIPLCSDESPFTGIMDGGNHSINNMTIIGGSKDYCIGLFTYLGDNAVISNLSLINVYIKGSNYMGSFVAIAGNSVLIENCSSSGNISMFTGNLSANSIGGFVGRGDSITFNNCKNSCNMTTARVTGARLYLGGIIGYSLNCNLDSCHNTGWIDFNEDWGCYVGGLGGYAPDSYTINSRNSGDIIGIGKEGNGGVVGGLMGHGGYFENCCNEGKVDFKGVRYNAGIGGLAGEGGKNISLCYNKGQIISTGYSLGGLLGKAVGRISLQNCYNVGTINREDSFGISGGLIGSCDYNTIDFANCYNSAILNNGSGAILGSGDYSGKAVYWFYNGEGTNYAVGQTYTLGIPSSAGTVKVTDISAFYSLADIFNEGLETPIWEHIGDHTLPTLINNKEENDND